MSVVCTNIHWQHLVAAGLLGICLNRGKHPAKLMHTTQNEPKLQPRQDYKKQQKDRDASKASPPRANHSFFQDLYYCVTPLHCTHENSLWFRSRTGLQVRSSISMDSTSDNLRKILPKWFTPASNVSMNKSEKKRAFT